MDLPRESDEPMRALPKAVLIGGGASALSDFLLLWEWKADEEAVRIDRELAAIFHGALTVQRKSIELLWSYSGTPGGLTG